MPKMMPIVRKRIYSYLLAAGLSAGAALGGAILIAPQEGLVLGTYKDAVGIVTSCYGHTGPELVLGQTFTQAQCDEQLAKDVAKHNKEMLRYVKVPLNLYQEAALTSFSYNVGIGNFSSSSLLKELNKGNYKTACTKLLDWVYAKKQKLKGLVTRRAQEMKVCMGEIDIQTELNK